MLTEVMEWLAAAVAAALGVTATKGFPNWGRTSLAPPVVAVELWGLGPTQGRPRVGEPARLASPSGRLTLFGKNEPDLWRLTALFAAWAEATPAVTVDGRKVYLSFEPGSRFESESGAEQENYGLQFIISIAW